MGERKQDSQRNPLILQAVYPDATAIFAFEPKPLKAVITDCLVVLDTNVLLVPYNTGQDSLEQIRKTYTSLVEKNRLIVPGQVAREFAQNRSEKLKTVFQQVSRKRDVSITRQAYPLLETVPEYQEVVRREMEINSQLGEYREAVGQLLDTIRNWYWNDPVSTLYREVFTTGVIHDFPVVEKDFLQDLENRQIHQIPPGYKDASKPDRGVGDLLIWKTILELGKNRGLHVVFVSGDEKADWWHRSENKSLFPRFELVDEFRRVSNGKSFYIISFAKLLESFGASSDVIQEIRKEEAKASRETPSSANADPIAQRINAERAVAAWLAERYSSGRLQVGDRGSPDFIVYEGSNRTGFQVELFQNSRSSLDHIIRQAEDFLLDRRWMDRVYVVFVTSTSEALEALASVVPRRPSRHPKLGFIIGILDTDGSFQEAFRQNPPGESTDL